jgi:hypothetical protein
MFRSNLYSLKNTPIYQQLQAAAVENNTSSSTLDLPPLLNNQQQQQLTPPQFSDTSCQDKSIMIDRIIDASAGIIDSIFYASNRIRENRMISTSRFICEILKRSGASYSMLQLALFYLFRIKKLVALPIYCGRRMFLAALMLASKYLNDKNYKNKTWAAIACLDVKEINAAEMIFLKLIDYQLHVNKPLYDNWISVLHDHIQKKKVYLQQQQKQFIPQPIMLTASVPASKPAQVVPAVVQNSSSTIHPPATPQQQPHHLSPAVSSVASSSPYTPNDISTNASSSPLVYNSSIYVNFKYL